MPRLIAPIKDTDHTQGSLEAPVTLVEYGDYQCQTCGLFNNVLKQLIAEMGNNLRYIYRSFPLKQTHPLAYLASEAAEAAGNQNKFWEMHEQLFKNQRLLNPDTPLELAKQLGLNLEQFQSDLQDSSITQKIEADFLEGVRSGVNGTPCFFINGERYDGDPSYHALLQALMQKTKS